jgi:hypothetical protein
VPEKSQKRNKAISLFPMKTNDALRVMLATPPMKKKKPVKRA